MKYESSAEKFSLSLAFIFLLIVIGLPLFYLIALQKNWQSIRDEKFKSLYGDFCEKYRYKRFDRLVLLEPFISSMRRLILATSVVFMFDYPSIALISAVI
jgi:hypothetical protein